MSLAEKVIPGLTAEERARSVWRRIGWRLKVKDMTWAENEEAIALIAVEIAQAAEAARR